MHSPRLPSLAQIALLTLLAPAAIAQITPGNLIVVRAGDGTAALTSAATAAFLDEYTPGGTFVQTIALPTTASGLNLQATVSGSATSEGFITQSSDGNYLVCTGYALDAGTAGSVVSTTSAATPRVIARIGLNGAIDTTTSINNLFSAGNIRAACTEDGSQFWATGSNSGVVLAAFGGTTGTTISTVTTNLRVPRISGGQLYTTSGSGTTTRAVNTVGTGVPTTTGQAIAPLNGMSSGTASPYDYWFADASTCYVADDRAPASGGGIQKWVESAGTWTLAYTLVPGTAGVRGLSGIVDQTGTTLFATTNLSSANQLVSVVDTGVGSTFTTLATTIANTAFRGVRFVRTPYGISLGGTACPTSVGVPTIGTTGGAPVSGNANFALTVGNAPAISGPGVGVTFWATAIGVPQLGLIPGGIQIPDAPTGCALLFAVPNILLTGLTDGTGSATVPVSLAPADSSLWNLPIVVQHAVFDFTGFYGSFGLPVGTTLGMQIVIGN